MCIDICPQKDFFGPINSLFSFSIICIKLKTTLKIQNNSNIHPFFQFMELNALKYFSYDDEANEFWFSGSIKCFLNHG